MRSVQVSKPKGPLEIVERDTPEPGARHVRIKVQACGICHSDSLTKEGLFPAPDLIRTLLVVVLPLLPHSTPGVSCNDT